MFLVFLSEHYTFVSIQKKKCDRPFCRAKKQRQLDYFFFNLWFLYLYFKISNETKNVFA